MTLEIGNGRMNRVVRAHAFNPCMPEAVNSSRMLVAALARFNTHRSTPEPPTQMGGTDSRNFQATTGSRFPAASPLGLRPKFQRQKPAGKATIFDLPCHRCSRQIHCRFSIPGATILGILRYASGHSRSAEKNSCGASGRLFSDFHISSLKAVSRSRRHF
jgi:hypothetical protein